MRAQQRQGLVSVGSSGLCPERCGPFKAAGVKIFSARSTSGPGAGVFAHALGSGAL
jgi:hypothetical protein